MFTNDLHPLKAWFPILVTEDRIETFIKNEQPLNAYPLIIVIAFGIEISFDEEQLWNTEDPK